MRLDRCRSCGNSDLVEILSLGAMPLANALLRPEDLARQEKRYPLTVVICTACSMLQHTESIQPAEIFSDYAYFSSRSDPIVSHARTLTARLITEYGLGTNDLVVEVASNDGYLLRNYVAAGIPALGIDPASNVADVARQVGVETITGFLTRELGAEVRASRGPARIVHANNVLAHVPHINDFVSAIRELLASEGVAVVETPYARNLVENLAFDTIYHEHVFYYTLTSASRLFERNGLRIVDVEWIPVHGGSLRLFAVPAGDSAAQSSAVLQMLAEEKRDHLDTPRYYAGFAERVDRAIAVFRSFLAERCAAGRRCAGYGAAAKATVLLNAAGIGPDIIEFVVDQTPYKQGRFVPGVRIPIVEPDALYRKDPDDVVIFAWNFVDEIIAKEQAYVQAGGTFVTPLPEPRVFPSEAPVRGI